MSDSLARYVEPRVIKTIQDICALEMDLSTNIFDAEGRINIISPSNQTPLCYSEIRGCPEGMMSCKQRDREGAVLLRWTLIQPHRSQEPNTPEIEFIRTVEPAFPVGPVWHPPIAVIYYCKERFIDFAVPIFDPSKQDEYQLLSIAYGGQYVLKGDPRDKLNVDKVYTIKDIEKKIQHDLKGGVKLNTVRKMLDNSRQGYWHQIVLCTHVMFALGNAMARLGEKFVKTQNQRLSWNKDNILRIYFEAFRILSGAQNGCIVFNNKWTNKFDIGVPCEGFISKKCHKNKGRLFARLREDSSLVRLCIRDTEKDPWWIGQEWVKQNHVFAVRDDRGQLIAIVNLNLGGSCPVPSEFSFDAMSHIAKQIAVFLQRDASLLHAHTQTDFSNELEQITRNIPANTGTLCSHVAKALTEEHGPKCFTKKCLVWLIDKADFSESQYLNNESILTCYAIGSNFPRVKKEDRIIPDVPLNRNALNNILKKKILTPAELEKEYPEFRKSKAYGDKFIGLCEGSHHLMVLPIIGEKDSDMENIAGLVVVVVSVTEYVTEEDYDTYSKFCYRLYDALQLVAERSKLEIERKMHGYRPILIPPFSRADIENQYREYLQKVASEIRQTIQTEGICIFLREGYPHHDPKKEGNIVLIASANRLNPKGRSCILDANSKEIIYSDKFKFKKYRPHEGCTGFCLCYDKDTVRIGDLNGHRKAFRQKQVKYPKWIGKLLEMRNPEIGRRGMICAQLRDKLGQTFGILRASSRTDGLRFTCIDENALRAIAQVISGQLESLKHEEMLGRRSQSLTTMARGVEGILNLQPKNKGYSQSLQFSVLIPLLIPEGFGLGRAAYCELRSGRVVSPVAIGGMNEIENNRVRNKAMRTFKTAIDAPLPLLRTGEVYDSLWREMVSEGLTSFRDRIDVKVDRDVFSGSGLGEALSSGVYQIVHPYTDIHKIDKKILNKFQGTLNNKYMPFAYIPIVGAFGTKITPRAFLYVDSPFSQDEELTEDTIRAIWTFASVLGGIWSTVDIRDRSTLSLRHFSHESVHALEPFISGHGAQEKDNYNLKAQFAYYRAMSVLAVFDPVKRGELRTDLSHKVSLYESMKRLTEYYRSFARTQGFRSLEKIPADPPRTKLKIRGSQAFLDAVLGQLLDNAVRYLVSANGKEQRAGFYSPKILKGGKYVQVDIWDTGPGMPENIPMSVFDRPYLGYTTVEGPGIGLLTCKMLLNIWIPGRSDSLTYSRRKGGGTVFHVVLPLA